MKHRALHVLLFCVLFIFSGCAGYHFKTNNNPLIGYDIRSVAVPMFINRTNIAGLGPMMTKEIILALNEYSGLKVYGGDNDNSDAVILGILESEDLINQTFKTEESLFTDKKIQESIGKRLPFYYPAKTSYRFNLRIVIIKRPSKEEINLLLSDIGSKIVAHPKIVLQETLNVTGSFTRAASDNLTSTSGGEVNFVKNKGILVKSLQDVCIQTANNFKQVVLNAF
jgi:hypothetical protein